MSKYISSRNPISASALKRRSVGAVVRRHGGREDVRFVRVVGGWLRSREDVTSETPKVVSSAAWGEVAAEIAERIERDIKAIREAA